MRDPMEVDGPCGCMQGTTSEPPPKPRKPRAKPQHGKAEEEHPRKLDYKQRQAGERDEEE
ncbi:MAG TPA: hypothetical protein VI953_03810 [Candidatus Paceibacterota bacterium]